MRSKYKFWSLILTQVKHLLAYICQCSSIPYFKGRVCHENIKHFFVQLVNLYFDFIHN